jgi:polysaccharide biosynthesis protein PslH
VDYLLKIFFTTPVLHHPPNGGPSLRIENTLKALSKVADIYIHSRIDVKTVGGGPAIAFYSAIAKDLKFSPSVLSEPSGIRHIFNALSRRFDKIRYSGDNNSYDAIDVVKAAARLKANLIWFGYGNISYPVIQFVKKHLKIPVVCDTDSVWSRFIERGMPYAESDQKRKELEEEVRRKEEEERAGTKISDITAAVSEIDAEYYRSLINAPERVHVLSNVIDIETYSVPPAPAIGLKRPCGFLGGTFWHGNSPMENAARWFLEKVLPLVLKSVPEFHLYIVGKESDHVLSDIKHPNVTITGELPSVLPYLCYSSVSLVPLHFESGTRFKVLEAGACKVPVVSTTLGAEGIPVEHGKDILIADDPQEFASSVVQIIKEQTLSKKLALNLHELVKREYSIDTLVRQITGILDKFK